MVDFGVSETHLNALALVPARAGFMTEAPAFRIFQKKFAHREP
jgi:hypothetical protein